MILGFGVTKPRAVAHLRQQIRRVGHAFHAASDDHVDRTGCEGFRAHDRGLHAGTAHLVDRGRLDRLGKTGVNCCLTGRGLALPGGQYIAHIDALDICACDASALDRCFDRDGTEIGSADFAKRALHAAHRGAGVRENDDRIWVGHVSAFLVSCAACRKRESCIGHRRGHPLFQLQH